jgi:hypothetical protein
MCPNAIPEVLSQKGASRDGIPERFSWNKLNFGSLCAFWNLFSLEK